jgi:hypothetical protein
MVVDGGWRGDMDQYLSSDVDILNTLMQSLGLPIQVNDNNLLLALLLQPAVPSMPSTLPSTSDLHPLMLLLLLLLLLLLQKRSPGKGVDKNSFYIGLCTRQ